jgi:bifunctional DNase/RNase
MGDEWTEVTVRGVVIDPMTGDPTVLLEDYSETAIIAVAGDPAVTGAIISELEGIAQEKAQTLLYRFFVRHAVVVIRVDLSADREGELGACLRYEYDGEHYGMEVRPIDGLLVAIQTEAPVYANAELIDAGTTPAAPRVLEGSDLLILSRRSAR